MRRVIQLVSILALLGAALVVFPATAGAQGVEYTVTQWELVEYIQFQPACTGAGYDKLSFTRKDCGFGRVHFDPAAAGTPVTVEFVNPDGTVVETQEVATAASGAAQFSIVPKQDWGPGKMTVRATVGSPDSGFGETTFDLNPLEVVASTAANAYAAGDDVVIEGLVREVDSIGCCETAKTEVEADVSVTLHDAEGNELAGPETTTADGSGAFTVTFPGAATAGLEAGPETDFQVNLAARAVATYDDPTPFVGFGPPPGPMTFGAWYGEGAAPVLIQVEADQLLLQNSFVSSVGWVKPDEPYPFRVLVRNPMDVVVADAQVTIPAPPGTSFLDVVALSGAGTASIGGNGAITWNLDPLAARTDAGPTVATLVVQAQAHSLDEDPEVVWKDISSTATLDYPGLAEPLTSASHGPKVIPPVGSFETARYGDKPFPIVPVDFRDRKHDVAHSGDALTRVVNSPDVEGSTFNLYQEMSYGQLFPIGEVPSASIATADFDYDPGFAFTSPDVTTGSCRGTTVGPVDPLWGTPVYPERIQDGWYQLPGDTEYYGGDYPIFSLGVAGNIDAACGETSKSVYDAAVIADPEIDYNLFDSDKDGVVDFFMMVFVGIGGNGGSQLAAPPYDNIWPHSSSLEFSYEDEATGLAGYMSDDQLTDLEGVPQCWVTDDYQTFDDCASNGGNGDDSLPTFVRVGPYNVNPEDAIEHASVISHEYGHHLGLPDFYSSFESYNDWNLMAADYSQHMTIFSKQDLGWVVPRFVQPGEGIPVQDWEEVKNDTGEIDWETLDGDPYTLSAANGDQNIHNGESYAFKLPRRLIIDPAKVEEQASAPIVYHSGAGNDFGCSPEAGHNLDIKLPELADVPADTPVTLTFKSSWDIEWDWDYGFTMVTIDGGANHVSLPSENGYTTENSFNPQGISCFARHNNGLTGQSGTYEAGTQEIERRDPGYADGSPFLDDEYDLSAFAGEENAVLRFSYFTDAGFSRPGWFIDDLVVTAGDQVIYETDFTDEDELRFFPGGCGDEGLRTAPDCTAPWSRIQTDVGIALDHAYYLELRDRSGFDFDGRGQSDRGAIGWSPGALIEYTDEARGYGNNGYDQPPNQQYLDSQPNPGEDCGGDDPALGLLGTAQCQNAAFTDAPEDSHFDDNPNDEGGDWIDNFDDPASADELWHFGYDCLTLDVTSMAGAEPDESLPSDLVADADLQAGPGCLVFDYWEGYDPSHAPVNSRPTAVADARPTDPEVGETVVFNGGRSSDDTTVAEDLGYEWDFDGDGRYDAEGQVVRHAYDQTGTYTASLRVTDNKGLTDVDAVEIVVGAAGGTTTGTTNGTTGTDTGTATASDTGTVGPTGGDPTPATGGGLALLGVAGLALAGAMGRRRRLP